MLFRSGGPRSGLGGPAADGALEGEARDRWRTGRRRGAQGEEEAMARWRLANGELPSCEVEVAGAGKQGGGGGDPEEEGDSCGWGLGEARACPKWHGRGLYREGG